MTDGYQLLFLLVPFVAAIVLGAILGTAEEIMNHYFPEESCSVPDLADPRYNPFASHVVGEKHGQR